MPISVELEKARETWQPPAAKPLDEGVWQAWVNKGRAQDRSDRAGRLTAAKWIAPVVLAALAALWFNFSR